MNTEKAFHHEDFSLRENWKLAGKGFSMRRIVFLRALCDLRGSMAV
jgi:hypothetical protein